MPTPIHDLLTALDAANIKYCYWKSSIHIEASFKCKTDLDILVEECSLAQTWHILRQANFLLLQTVPLRASSGTQDFCLLCTGGTWAHVHLYHKLFSGDRWVKAYHFPVEKEVLLNSRYSHRHKACLVAPFDELMLFGLRMSLKFLFPFSKEPILKELAHIKTRCGKSTLHLFEAFQKVPSLEKFTKYVMETVSPSPKELNTLARSLAREMCPFRRYGRMRFFYLTWKRKLYRYFIELRRRKLHNFRIGRRSLLPKGKIIAFVGLDGAGKTSAITAMNKVFGEQMNVCCVFLGAGQSGANWLRKLIFLPYRILSRDKRDHLLKTLKNPSSFGSELYALWTVLCLKDRNKNFRTALAAKNAGALVFADRWPQSKIPGTLDGPRLSTYRFGSFTSRYAHVREKKFYATVTSCAPDLMIRLNISPSLSLVRAQKDKSSLERRQTEARLVNTLPWEAKNVVDIDASLDKITLYQTLREEIWSFLTKTK